MIYSRTNAAISQDFSEILKFDRNKTEKTASMLVNKQKTPRQVQLTRRQSEKSNIPPKPKEVLLC